MTYLFLENPKYLLIFLAFIDFILVFSLKRVDFDKKKIAIIVISVLIPAIYMLSHFVETDNEKIEKILVEISKTSNKLEIDSVTKYLDKEFIGHFDNTDYSAEEFIKLLKEKVGEKTVNGINLDKRKIVFITNKAETTIISHVDLTTTSGVFRLSLKWEITWIKRKGKWYLFKTATPKRYIF